MTGKIDRKRNWLPNSAPSPPFPTGQWRTQRVEFLVTLPVGIGFPTVLNTVARNPNVSIRVNCYAKRVQHAFASETVRWGELLPLRAHFDERVILEIGHPEIARLVRRNSPNCRRFKLKWNCVSQGRRNQLAAGGKLTQVGPGTLRGSPNISRRVDDDRSEIALSSAEEWRASCRRSVREKL